MPMNLDKYRKRSEEREARGKAAKFREGKYLFYLAPPPGEEEVPDVSVMMHRNVGPPDKQRTFVCLGPENQGVFESEGLREALRYKGKKSLSTGSCQCCSAVVSDELDEKACSGSEQRFFPLVCVGRFDDDARGKPKRVVWDEENWRFGVYWTAGGGKVSLGVDAAIREEKDITDPDRAIFLVITKTGTGWNSDYSCEVDTVSLQTPVKISKAMRRTIVGAQRPGGTLDAFGLVARYTKSNEEMEKAIAGHEVGETDEEPKSRRSEKVKDDPVGSREKACFGRDYVAGDSECKECEVSRKCRMAMESDDDADDEPPPSRGREQDDDADDEPPPSRGREQDDDADDEPPPSRGRKQDDDADDEPPPSRGKKQDDDADGPLAAFRKKLDGKAGKRGR